MLLLGSIGLGGVCSWLGISGAMDSTMRRMYYQVRGERSTSVSVVLVALDEGTVKEWGAPPWSWEQLERLGSAIMAGNPKLVAMLEPSPRVLPDGEPEGALADVRAQGRLVMPPVSTGFVQPSLRVDTWSIDTVHLQEQDGMQPVLAQVIERLGLPLPAGGALPINFRGSPSSLPTVAGHRVASGEIPASTFTDRIVVIGLQGERFAPMLPTPVGAMSPAQVQAHALSGLLDGATWRPIPVWSRWLVIAGLVCLALFGVPRLSNRAVSIVAGVSLATLIAADYGLFASGTLLLGVADPALALSVAMMGSWMLERARVVRDLAEFSAWLTRQVEHEARAGAPRRNDTSFLDSFLRSVRTYFDFHSSIFAELAPGSHHLEFTLCVDTSFDDVCEKRRDIRREPYSSAHQSHRPEWAVRPFMNEELGLKTLMVPLVELGRTLGYWIINFPAEVEVAPRTLTLIGMLGDQASIALDRRRLLQRTALAGKPSPLAASSVVLAELGAARQTAASLMQSQYRVDELFERLPVGVLVATLWGDIEMTNAGMRTLLSSIDIDDPTQLSLPELIARISGENDEEVRLKLRQLIDHQTALRIRMGGESSNGESTHDILLTRVFGRGGMDSSDNGNAAAHFVLTATERVHRFGAREIWLREAATGRTGPVDTVARNREDSGSFKSTGPGVRRPRTGGDSNGDHESSSSGLVLVDLTVSKKTGSDAK